MPGFSRISCRLIICLGLTSLTKVTEAISATCEDTKAAYKAANCCKDKSSTVTLGRAYHDFHPGVSYMDITTALQKAKAGEFDVVFDIRQVEGPPDFLEGHPNPYMSWRDVHAAGSYPLNMSLSNILSLISTESYNRSCDTLGPFGQSYQGCKDKKVLVTCWSGGGSNFVVKWLTQKCGWTNVFAAGPAGEAGVWHYSEMPAVIDMGIVVRNDTTPVADLVPACASQA